MTTKDVRNYRFLARMIRKAARRVDDLSTQSMLSDKVYGSNPEYPYEQRSFEVHGLDEKAEHRRQIDLEDAMFEYHRLVTLQMEIETASRSLKDKTEKTIFDMTMKGEKQEVIAKKLGLERSTVAKKLARICEDLSFPDGID